MKQLVYLADHPQLLPAIAKLGFQEFGHLNPGQTVESRLEKITNYLNRDSLPILFVALLNNEIIGTTTLHYTDIETYAHVSPWLASVIIAPEKRHQGMGTWMVQETMKKALDLGINTWYLYTSNRESFYAKMGWQTIDKIIYQHSPGVIMQFNN